MINWDELRTFLAEQGITNARIEFFGDFLRTLSFEERQMMMRIMATYSEKLPFMAEILEKKRSLAKRFDPSLAKEVAAHEFQELKKAAEAD